MTGPGREFQAGNRPGPGKSGPAPSLIRIQPRRSSHSSRLKIRPNSRRSLASSIFCRMIPVPNFARVVQPLHHLRKKDVHFKWTSEHDNAFKQLPQLMSDGLVLVSSSNQSPWKRTSRRKQLVLFSHSRTSRLPSFLEF